MGSDGWSPSGYGDEGRGNDDSGVDTADGDGDNRSEADGDE